MPLVAKPSLSSHPDERVPSRQVACGAGAAEVGHPTKVVALEAGGASCGKAIVVGQPCHGGAFEADGVWRQTRRRRLPCRGGMLEAGGTSCGEAIIIGLPCRGGAFEAGGKWRRSHRGRLPCLGGVLKAGGASCSGFTVVRRPRSPLRDRRHVEAEPLRCPTEGVPSR